MQPDRSGQPGHVALVIGAGGLVGGNLVSRLLERGWTVFGVSRGERRGTSGRYHHIPCDITDAAACAALPAACPDVTHVFYAARASGGDPALEAALNGRMLRNVMESGLARIRSLAHVTLVHGTKWYGSHLGEFRTPAREDDPRHAGPNFYFEQHDFIASLQKECGWHWSTVRPHIVLGQSTGYPFNCLTTIAAYGTLCREMGRPFDFPGSEKAFAAITQATDAGLLAEAMIWTAQDPRCDNQSFNIINGDYFRWKNLWPALAAFFGAAPGGPVATPMSQLMAGAEGAWTAIVNRHALKATPLSALANWTFGEFLFRAEWDVLSSIVKSRQNGFHEALDTEANFLNHLAVMRRDRLIP